MTAVALADAFVALLPGSVETYDGQVAGPDGTVPTPPWVHVSVSLPVPLERTLGRPARLVACRARILAYGMTATSVRVIASQVLGTVEGARPAAAGWRCSPVEVVNTRDVVEDRGVTVASSNRHPMFGVVECLFTASPTLT